MADFMTNFDNQRQAYLEHYGVKGMRWGVHTTVENNQMTHRIEIADPKKANVRSTIESASPDAVKKRSQSIRKRALVLGGIGAVLTAIGAASVVGDYKRRNSPDSVLTKEGAALKNFIKGGKR